MDKFLIFGVERSGTTSLLCALGTICPVAHEPFHSSSGDIGVNARLDAILTRNKYAPDTLPADDDPDFEWNKLHFVSRDPARCADYLAQLYDEFTGLKHIWSSVSRAANRNILDWCFAHDVKIIYQSRRNLARALISLQLATQSQIWQMGGELEQRQAWEEAQFDPINMRLLRNLLTKRGSEHEFFQSSFADRTVFEVFYEDLYLAPRAQQESVMRALCDFISLPLESLTGETLENWIYRESRRQSTRDTLRRIPNYRDLEPYL